ncbi:PiggyBac transposable element-derived protein 4 [Merluccius polli]|uniref:PiggyBac transposable element-derived protein 4 n=1 Tax=Merluccius polli TaxID=89951 RepID=A0AA47NVU2_MERPO|nr:PiggyBac transposable element-derived protein 4 [Merluccius polli]
MDKHRYQVSQKDDLTFCAWQDTKVVLVLSNYHEPMAEGSVRRRQGEDIQTEVIMPVCVSDYQKNMKGVDLLDQMVSYYQFQHQSKKWWRRLFFFFLSVSCYNSFIAARSAGAYKGGYKEWQEDLAYELVTPVTAKSAPQCAAAPVTASAERDCEKIFEKRKICRECSLSKSGTEARPGATVYGCKQCNVPLHIECFGKNYRSTRQHDKRAVWAHIKPVLEDLKSKQVRDIDTLHVISDGPVTQYRNKTNCYLMSTVPFTMGFKHVTWNYSERSHGKGALDGVGGAVKRMADMHVQSGNDLQSPRDVYEFLASKMQTNVKFKWIEESDIEPYDNMLPPTVRPVTCELFLYISQSRLLPQTPKN